jgi:ribonuclease Z
MIRITLLGTGTPAPLPHRQGPATLVSIGDEHLLFDAGRGVTTQLVQAGVDIARLGPIFLTHHNYDHIGNLGDLLLSVWHADHPPPLHVIGPQGTDGIVDALLTQVYAREIAFSMRLAQAMNAPMHDIVALLAVETIAPGAFVDGGVWRVQVAAVEHGERLGLSYAEWPCLGYRVEVDDAAIAISGDTVACPGLAKLAADADVLVQCCHVPEAAVTTAAQHLLANAVIASAAMAGQIAATARVPTLVQLR